MWLASLSLIKHHQVSSKTALDSVFGKGGYLADEAEMGLIRLIPEELRKSIRGNSGSKNRLAPVCPGVSSIKRAKLFTLGTFNNPAHNS